VRRPGGANAVDVGQGERRRERDERWEKREARTTSGAKRREFVAMGKAMGGGSGWVLLTYSHRDRKLVNQWAADHTHSIAGATPILALDMYEHSYHIDYGAAAAKYVDAFMKNINWTNVARFYQALAR